MSTDPDKAADDATPVYPPGERDGDDGRDGDVAGADLGRAADNWDRRF